MDLMEALNRFYYAMTLHELQQMNQSDQYPDITYNSLLYLELIALHENCTVSSLADALHISRAAVTTKVGELMRQGFIEKTRSERDGRVHYLTVRPEILTEFKAYDGVFQRAAARMRDTYPKEELERFCRMLNDYTEFYQEGQSNEKPTCP